MPRALHTVVDNGTLVERGASVRAGRTECDDLAIVTKHHHCKALCGDTRRRLVDLGDVEHGNPLVRSGAVEVGVDAHAAALHQMAPEVPADGRGRGAGHAQRHAREPCGRGDGASHEPK